MSVRQENTCCHKMRFIAVRARRTYPSDTSYGAPAINLYFSCPDMAKPCRSDKKNTRCHKMRFIAVRSPVGRIQVIRPTGLPAINLYFFVPTWLSHVGQTRKYLLPQDEVYRSKGPVGRIQVIRPTGLPAINLYFPDMAKPCRSDKKIRPGATR